MDYSSIGYKRAMSKARWVDELDNKLSLELSTGTVAGEKYFTVQPNWMHKSNNWFNMEIWCLTQFGPIPQDGVWTPGARWYMNNRKFWFRNEADLSWFLLKWS
jgi:hypothetical protein